MSVLREIRIFASTEGGASRQETLLGRTYTVFPVVMLVEGVLQGANAEAPEYVPGTEIAKAPAGWNGRPLVMNHPQIQGAFVSANHPEVLEDWSFGYVFNTVWEDPKLKAEAWIDNERAEELGGDAKRALERLNAGETVEVSTGLFVDVTKKSGRFNKRDYKGVWANIVPDHLAILDESQLGACSIADGCGANRTNTQAGLLQAASAAGGMRLNASALRTFTPESEDCGCGGSCGGCGNDSQESQETRSMSFGKTAREVLDFFGFKNVSVHGGSDEQTASNPQVEGLGSGSPDASEQGPVVNAEDVDPTPEELDRLNQGSVLAANAVAGAITLDNVRDAVRIALHERFRSSYLWLQTLTTDVVVFTMSRNGYGDCCYSYEVDNLFQLPYSITEDGVVTLTGEPEPVRLLTKIVPRQVADEVVANSGESNQEVNAMPGENTQSGSAATDGQTVSGSPALDSANTAPQTLDAALSAMPAELRAHIQRSLARDKAHKDSLIAQIKANGNNKLSDAILEGMEIEVLEGVVALSGGASDSSTATDYSGRASPGAHQTTPAVNARTDDAQAPEPLPVPKVFTGVVASRFDPKVKHDLGDSPPQGNA